MPLTSEQIIERAMVKIESMGAEGTVLIVEQTVIPIEEALREYRPELIAAFNQEVRYNGDMDLSKNFKSFLKIDLVAMGLLTDTYMPDCSTRNSNIRSAERNPKSFKKISKLMNIIYRAVYVLERAED